MQPYNNSNMTCIDEIIEEIAVEYTYISILHDYYNFCKIIDKDIIDLKTHLFNIIKEYNEEIQRKIIASYDKKKTRFFYGFNLLF